MRFAIADRGADISVCPDASTRAPFSQSATERRVAWGECRQECLPHLLALLLLLCAAVQAEDTITLKDGRTISGTIVKEDEESVFISQNGEQRGIAKSRIEKIDPKPAAPVDPKAAAAEPKPKTVMPAPAALIVQKPGAPEPIVMDLRSSGALIDKVRELGLPDPKARKTAQAEISAKKDEYMPAMLGMLHPKFDSDEFTRIGILRLLAANAPLTEVGSRMLAFVAIHDPHPEVRREACVTIRTLADDDAIRELMRFCQVEDATTKKAVAVALHEIDDKRLLASIIRAIPAPSVTANQGEPTGLDQPKYNLPVGPGGTKLPIWLPAQEVSGVATDIDSPAADLLKLIAKKDLGNMPYSWLNWFREKIGDISQAERDTYKEKRSLRGRMGTPPGDSGSQ